MQHPYIECIDTTDVSIQTCQVLAHGSTTGFAVNVTVRAVLVHLLGEMRLM